MQDFGIVVGIVSLVILVWLPFQIIQIYTGFSLLLWVQKNETVVFSVLFMLALGMGIWRVKKGS